jgi:uncharacterized protein
MSSRIPDRVDPWQLCAKGEVLKGRVALRELQRLVPLLTSDGGEAAFTLAFSKDADRRAVIHGELSADLRVACQRCLRAMTLAVRETVDLAPVRGLDEASRLPEEFDPVLVEDHGLDLRELLADELILAVPTTPRHENGACEPPDYAVAETGPAEAAERENPFAALSSLKRGDRSKDH